MYPPGVGLGSVQFGAALASLGGVATIEATIKLDRTLVHVASGTTIHPFEEAMQQTGTGVCTAQVLFSDQSGFRDLAGNDVTGWSYTMNAKISFPGVGDMPTRTQTFQLTSDQTGVVDLDLLFTSGISLPPSTAPSAYVSSVAGGTGVVTAEQLLAALLPGLSQTIDTEVADLLAYRSSRNSGLPDSSFGLGIGALVNGTSDAVFTIAIGYHAGNAGTNLANSLLIGVYSGTNLAGNGPHMAIGNDAWRYHDGSTGNDHNIAIGLQAGAGVNVDGSAPSSLSGGGSANIWLGVQAGWVNKTGGGNIGIGFSALRFGANPNGSIAIGTNSQYKNSGTGTISIGTSAMLNATAANYVVAIGDSVLANVTTGSSIVALGIQAGYNVTTGGSLVLLGANSGQKVTTGGDSVFIGVNAGNNFTNASVGRGVAIGNESDVATDLATTIGYQSRATALQATAIGAQAKALHNGSVALGADVSTTAINQLAFGAVHLKFADILASAAVNGSLFTEGGALKFKGGNGTLTTLAAA